MNTTDEQIVASYQATGRDEAFDLLVARHLGRVRDFAYRMVLCNATADDIAQEVFVKVYRNLGNFRGDAKFTTWLYRVTINTVRENRRGRSRHPPEPLAGVDPPARAYEQPDRKAMDAELAAEIEKALGLLSEKLRTAIVLTLLEGLPAKEAAAIEGCTVSTIHWRIHQARKELKRTLKRRLER